ncbi:MAG: HPF/RaiA family ribosome-associated protein [Candidatus Uhrbacteria bacterium]
MEISYSFKKLSEFDQHFCRQYLAQKSEAIVRALPKLKPDAEVRLEFRAERFAKKKAFRVSLALQADANRWIAEEDDHTLREAIDLTRDKLVLQMRKRHRQRGTEQG